MVGEITKREMIGIGSVGAAMLVMARQTQAQEPAQQGQIQATVQITPEQARSVHNQYVAELRKLTPDRQPFNRDNLVRLVDELESAGLINSVQRELLVKLIDVAFISESRDELQSRVEEIIASALALATTVIEGVTAYIVDIYRSSISIAADILADVDWPSMRTAIVKDFGGAALGATIGGPFGPQAAIIGIVFCGTAVSAFGYAEAGTA